jgi:hypothetical protein
MEVTFRTHPPGGPGFCDVSAVFTDAAKGVCVSLLISGISLTRTNRLGPGRIIVFSGLYAAGFNERFRSTPSRPFTSLGAPLNVLQQIGEPRLDSGFILDEDNKPPFNPLAPLLPEELCWILDRAFACEVNHYNDYSCRIVSQTTYLDGMACWDHPFANRVDVPLRIPPQ